MRGWGSILLPAAERTLWCEKHTQSIANSTCAVFFQLHHKMHRNLSVLQFLFYVSLMLTLLCLFLIVRMEISWFLWKIYLFVWCVCLGGGDEGCRVITRLWFVSFLCDSYLLAIKVLMLKVVIWTRCVVVNGATFFLANLVMNKRISRKTIKIEYLYIALPFEFHTSYQIT